MQPLHGCLQHTLFTGISNTNMSLAARAECAARNADDLLALEQLLAEFLARQAERADVRESVERALRLGADNAVDPGQPVQQQLSAARKYGTQLFAQLRMLQSAIAAAYCPGALAQALKFSRHLTMRSMMSAGPAA